MDVKLMLDLNKNNTKFVVLGGGTAGWMAAIFLKKNYPNVDLTVIESSEIGILGAGEGTTPHVYRFFEEMDIPFSDLVKHASATIKTGIKFSNWNGNKKSYYHPFTLHPEHNYFSLKSVKSENFPKIVHEKVVTGESLDDINLGAIAAERYKVTIIKNTVEKNTKCGNYSLHFNARMLADFLKNVAISRGVKLIDSEVMTIETDDSGYINKLNLKNETSLDVDFVFDCTGFKRVVIGKFYQSRWKSYQKYLPVNKALPFFIEHSENEKLPPYTEAIAMKYGWMWKIPVRGRYGCGYVFDSRFIDADMARNEITNCFGNELRFGNTFNFEAGTFETPWVKNCIAIGLSSGFIEPLEATSIWISVWGFLNKMTRHISGVTHRNESAIKIFNESAMIDTESVLNFIYFHYITKRTDTDFWKNFINNNEMPSEVRKLVEFDKDIVYVAELLNKHGFPQESWFSVGLGLNFFNRRISEKNFGSNSRLISNEKITFQSKLNKTCDTLFDHNDYLNNII